MIAFALPGLLGPASVYGRTPKAAPPPLFFPLPPDPPRIQFLTSFSSEEGLQGERKFYTFIVGTEKIHRPIVKPYGIASSPGKIYIADTVPAVVEVADLKKRRMSYFQPGGDATLGLPINIAVDGDGTRYITDTKRNQVLVFRGDNFAGAIGKVDEMTPSGVALSGKRIYVTDLQNHCVRVYDKGSLNLLFTFPKAGGDKNAQLYSPTNVAIDPQGRVYVSDTGAYRVNLYDADGKYLRSIGRQGLEPGTFARPKGIAVDREGRLYVADANTQVIQLFDDQGRLLMYFGDPLSTSGAATCMPAGIAIDYDNVSQFQRFVAPGFSVEYLILLVNQFGDHKISVFGFGQKK